MNDPDLSSAHSYQDERQRILEAYRKRQEVRPLEFSDQGYENLSHRLRVEERYHETYKIIKDQFNPSIADLKILDFGCGDGNFLKKTLDWGAQAENLTGIELRENVLREARKKLPHSHWIQACGSELPLSDQGIDIVVANTVFSSILLTDLQKAISVELERVLKPEGLIIIYDFHRKNPHNIDVQAMPLEKFKPLFGGFDLVYSKSITFRPDWARKFPSIFLKAIFPLLSAFPSFKTHHLSVFKKKSPNSD